MGLARDVTAYRDRPIQCPRCRRDLIQRNATDGWSCEKCHGVLFATGDLIAELLKIAPTLLPAGGVTTITTIGRRTTQPLLVCGKCSAPMEPVFLGGESVDRCYHDELFWFDAGELALVGDCAAEQAGVPPPKRPPPPVVKPPPLPHLVVEPRVVERSEPKPSRPPWIVRLLFGDDPPP